MVWIVATKFNAFYIAEALEIPRNWETKIFKSGEKKSWAKMKDCWKITRSKKLFYGNASVDMKYVLIYGESDIDPRTIGFEDLIKELKERRRW